MQKIKIPTLDHKNIAANIFTPEKTTHKLAILCPGYLHSKDYAHLVTLSEGLVAKGYTVVSFDPVGTWESDGTIADYTITEYLKNIKTVLDYMLEKGDYKYVLLGGHSRGGGVSLLYAEKDKRISQVLGIMTSPQNPLGDERFKLWKQKGFESSTQVIPGTSEQKEFLVPFSYAEDRSQYNVTEAVKNLNIPIFLISGEEDDLVGLKDLENILEKAKGPKKLVTVPKAGHIYWGEEETLNTVNQKILEHL